MQVERLRLLGFKSFVDGAELPIEPGLTGIVGPNGCGKSNLAEALRWVMGETSARRLRGGAMDDVIFAGAAGRPARNLAEVALTFDNSARDAPFAGNGRDRIEIVRRIERGGGSAYRINGREARARDVQLLFADAASGAGSGALISQGRIGALIEAKPADRRLLLEGAAGTAGLLARRRETEQRLEAAAANLLRLDDVIATIDAQFEALKKQARQAQRYRRLGEHIRRAEALLFHARRTAAVAEAERGAGELRAAERAVAGLTERALCERRRREAAEAALPQLRRGDAEAAAGLQRLTQARDGLEEELRRVLAERDEAERRLVHLAADLGREDELLADAAAALAGLAQERRALDRADAEDGPAREAAAAALQAASAGLAEAEAALQRATEAAAAAEAGRTALAGRRRDLDEHRARLRARRAQAERERATLAAAEAPTAAAAAAAAGALDAAAREAEQSRAAVEAAERRLAARRAQEAAALDTRREVDTALARLGAEAAALEALLAPPPDAEPGEPVWSAVQVAAGFEAAVGAAFADELSAPLTGGAGPSAAGFWRDLPALENPAPLPAAARPLAEAMTAPSALGRRLALTGWVEDEAAGRELQPYLGPGQRLVDRAGRLWRWDGFTRIAPRPSPAAHLFRHKNRLAVLAEEIASREADSRAAAAAAAAARGLREQAAEADRLARARRREAEAELARARDADAALARRMLTAQTQLAAAVDAIGKLTADLAELDDRAGRVERELGRLPQAAGTKAALEEARGSAGAARRREAAALAAAERLSRAATERRQRAAAIDRDEGSWRQRSERSTAQRAALIARRGAAEAGNRRACRPPGGDRRAERNPRRRYRAGCRRRAPRRRCAGAGGDAAARRG